MNEPRQRVTRALVTAGGTLLLFGLSSGCEARSSLEGAQTAVAIAQTSLPEFQNTLPDVQATAQAGATLVTGVLSEPLAINAQLQVVLLGATVDVRTSPADARGESVRQVTATATDERGTVAQLDPRSRQAVAGAALALLSQYYAKAALTLIVVGIDGSTLISETRSRTP